MLGPKRISRESNVAHLAEPALNSRPRVSRSVLAFHSPENNLSFRKHRPSEDADIRVARKSCPEQLSAGFFVSVSAPHYATKKYIVAFHVVSFQYKVCSAEIAYCLACGEALNQIPITTYQ